MALNRKHVDSVLALPDKKRFDHFVKVVADRQEIWGLYLDGWALAATNDGVTVFPLWPAKEYAQLCAVSEWEGYEPRLITLAELMEDLFPKLKKDGVLPGVFSSLRVKG
ncbi:DUF2750 domain-containing protein [Comamonas sp.]|uniref:DUF2750 domain-containing protein n=1 Tax=Comamonas sp. TaxID=34028 RepID=UPI00289C44E3|nr:DUF2750 domain-containing protein [Comamonas sp.]